MKIVYNWLKEFVPVAATPQELAARLSLAGTNIAGVETIGQNSVLDAEITSNRPDCLGHHGIAREVSAIYKLPLQAISPKVSEVAEKSSDAIKIEIQSPELCARFTARVIRAVRIQPSPGWLKEKLEACGVASINNIVDATNYVMMELGHPLHAFDYDKIRDHKIVVRAAHSATAGKTPAEKIKTLDGLERPIDPNICLVCDGDGSRPVGIGGIMGGAETEISFATKNILIECAWFNPIAIRRAAHALRLHTEASTRFGRGADPEMAELASRRCAELILQLAGGQLLAGVVDVYPGKHPAKTIRLTRAEILRVMGADVPDKEIESILGALGFSPVRADETRGSANSLLAAWTCTQPSWRADAEREIDLIEEIARVYGLDKFPPRLPAARAGASRLPHFEAENRLRERLIGLGYREILTIPHVAEDRDALFRPAEVAPAKLANPLSEEAGVLRSTGIVSMAGALEWNLNHGQRNVRLFEISHRYRLHGGECNETRVLTIGATGEAQEKGLHQNAREFSFADLKGDIDNLGSLSGSLRWQETSTAWLNPAKRGEILLGTEPLGVAGQLARRVAERLKLRQDIFLAEINLGSLYCAFYGAKNSRRYQPIPRFPAVERDFSLLLAAGTPFADIKKTILALNIPELVSIEATDFYQGKNVPAGKFSLLIKATLQSRESTLTDAHITSIAAKIVAALEQTLGAQLRTV